MKFGSLDGLVKKVKQEDCNLDRLSSDFETRLRARLSQRSRVSKTVIRLASMGVVIFLGIFVWLKMSQRYEEQFYTDIEEIILAGYEDEIGENEMGGWLWNDF